MVSINYSSREVCCKIVYYGPGLSGKTTNLQYVHAKVPQNSRGKLISLATEADRTLYFDFLPINIGTINGLQAKFQLYTVPGQVYYNATRKLVLRGVDGIVFVADSQPDKMDENIESLTNLEENLQEYGYNAAELPMVIQYNKRDLPGVLSVEALNARLNPSNKPHFEASASIGNGVFDTLKLIIRLVLEKAKTNAPSPAATAVSVPKAVPVVDRAADKTADYPAPSPRPLPVMATQSISEPVCEPVHAVAASVSNYTKESHVRVTVPVANEPSARPYPGSSRENALDRPSVPSAPQPKRENFEETTPQSRYEEEYQLGRAARPWSGMSAPHMAPSTRNRNESKKRGFFKRLFGIK